MNKEIIALILAILVSSLTIFNLSPSDNSLASFTKFKDQYGKKYLNEAEESYRKSIFLMNLAIIETHNADSTQTYTLGVTQFADLTQN